MCAEAPFETEGEGEVVLRGDAVVAECELVGELGPRGKKAAERILQADADRKRSRAFRRGESRRRSG